MKNRIISFCIFLCIGLCGLTAVTVAPGENPTFVKGKGDIDKIGKSQVDFDLNLSQVGVFDAGFSSIPVAIGVSPNPVRSIEIKEQVVETDFYQSSEPVFLYLRFFGSTNNLPKASILIDRPLMSSSNGVIHWKAVFRNVVSDEVQFELDSKTKKPYFVTPDLPADKALHNVVYCYKVTFETIDEYWKAAPDSYSSELWLKITTKV